MERRRETLKRHDDRQEPSKAAKAFMAGSALFTLLLLGFLVWQGIQAPSGGEPEARVAAITPRGDHAIVEVELENHGERGLEEVEVEVRCGEDPPKVLFSNVPANGMRSASVRCPDATPPEVGVTYWIRA